MRPPTLLNAGPSPLVDGAAPKDVHDHAHSAISSDLFSPGAARLAWRMSASLSEAPPGRGCGSRFNNGPPASIPPRETLSPLPKAPLAIPFQQHLCGIHGRQVGRVMNTTHLPQAVAPAYYLFIPRGTYGRGACLPYTTASCGGDGVVNSVTRWSCFPPLRSHRSRNLLVELCRLGAATYHRAVRHCGRRTGSNAPRQSFFHR